MVASGMVKMSVMGARSTSMACELCASTSRSDPVSNRSLHSLISTRAQTPPSPVERGIGYAVVRDENVHQLAQRSGRTPGQAHPASPAEGRTHPRFPIAHLDCPVWAGIGALSAPDALRHIHDGNAGLRRCGGSEARSRGSHSLRAAPAEPSSPAAASAATQPPASAGKRSSSVTLRHRFPPSPYAIRAQGGPVF